jgi:hypothetical protein
MNEAAPWLERELARQLAPVNAPASLWNRIQEPRPRFGRSDSLRWLAWPAVVLMTLIVCAGLFRRMDRARQPDREPVEFAGSSNVFDLRSSDFAAIRSWVKTQAAIDIDLPEGAAATDNAIVRLFGVRLIRVRGLRVAAIDYGIGDDVATLFVSEKRGARGTKTEATKHLFSSTKSTGETRVVSWNMTNQNYTIAFSGAGDAHGACLLCHANTPGLVTMN